MKSNETTSKTPEPVDAGTHATEVPTPDDLLDNATAEAQAVVCEDVGRLFFRQIPGTLSQKSAQNPV